MLACEHCAAIFPFLMLRSLRTTNTCFVFMCQFYSRVLLMMLIFDLLINYSVFVFQNFGMSSILHSHLEKLPRVNYALGNNLSQSEQTPSPWEFPRELWDLIVTSCLIESVQEVAKFALDFVTQVFKIS